MTKENDKNTETEISWRAAEYDHFEKSPGWYAAVGGTALILFIIALWQKNFFFGIFVLLAGIMVIFLSNRKPSVLEYKFTEKGFEIGHGHGIFYEYDKLDNFSLRSRPGRLDELILKRKITVNPFVRVPIDDRTAEKVRLFLVQKLPEVEHHDSMMDVLTDLLGF